jgi:hypothetical protein
MFRKITIQWVAIFCCFLLFLNASHAQSFGNGTLGSVTITNPNTQVNQYTEVISVDQNSFVIEVNNSSYFTTGKKAILMQMTGVSAGYWEWVHIFQINSTSIIVLNISNIFDPSGGAVQLIAVPDYLNLTISPGASIVPLTWNGAIGGVAVVMVSGTLTINAGGLIDASGYGFQSGAAGIAGSGGQGGTAGIAPGGNGGNNGIVINTGIGGGGDGGAKGNFGLPGTVAQPSECPGCAAVAINSGSAINNILMMGGAGKSANGGSGRDGAGGGGGSNGSSPGQNGTAGGNGGSGGSGGLGGAGGGIIIVSANILNLPAQACMKANGKNALAGQSGVAAGAGGNGGLGGGGCLVGGGGGGGNGADGGNGGGGGNGGAGGMIKIIRGAASSPPATIHRQATGGLGATGGSGGTGGPAGLNAGNLSGMNCSTNPVVTGPGGGPSFGASSCDANLVLSILQDMGAGGLNDGVYTNLGNGLHEYSNGTNTVYIEEINALTIIVRFEINGVLYYTVISGTGSAPSPLSTIQQIFDQGNITIPIGPTGMITGSSAIYTVDCSPVRNEPQDGVDGDNGPDGVDADPGDFSDEVGVDCSSDPITVSYFTGIPYLCPELPASIQAFAIGGTSPYQFTYSPGGTSETNYTGIFTVGPNPGSLSVTDANGCTSDIIPAIVDQRSLFQWGVIQINPSCPNENNGSAVFEVDPLYDPTFNPFTDIGILYYVADQLYNIYYPNFISSTNATFENLPPGIYTVYQEQCINDPYLQFEIIESVPISANPIVNNPVCDMAGSIQLQIDGGTAPYSVLWSDSQTSNPAIGIFAQTISATITDANGCTFTDGYTINGSSGPLTILFQNNPEYCVLANGNSTAIVTGGTAPYTYQWSDSSTGSTLLNAATGNYSLTVTDANGCIASASTTIGQAGAIPVIVGTVTDVTCFGYSNGDITVNASGGLEPYSYLWSTNSTTQSSESVGAGNYQVTVTTADGCVGNASFTVLQPNVLEIFGTITQPVCANNFGGSIDVTIGGGNSGSGYIYNWSHNDPNEDQMNLQPGEYTITVYDASECMATATYTIVAPPAFFVTGVVTHDLCSNNSGAIDITITGGLAPYQYLWNTSESTEDISNLAAGSYNVVVTDAAGCTATANFVVNGGADPIKITLDLLRNVRCYGGNTGLIYTSTTGGTAPYTYLWSNGDTNSFTENLSAGNYSLTVTDANGCVLTESFDIFQPALPLNATITGSSIVCKGTQGYVTITASGGSPLYYGEGLFAVYPGMNTFIVSDKNDCYVTLNWLVTEVDFPQVSLLTTPSCENGPNGSIASNVTSGTPAYSYLWSNNATTVNLTNIPDGYYSLTVTDANGCSASSAAEIKSGPPIDLGGTATGAFCVPSNSGSINIDVTGGFPAYSFLWNNNATIEDLTAAPAGTYSVVVTDAVGCTASASFFVSDGCICPPNFQAEICGPSAICQGESLTLNSLVMPSTQGFPVTYSWTRTPATFTSTAANITQSGLTAGTYTYTLVVTYGPACSTTVQHTVVVRPRPTITLTNSLTGNNTLATQLAGCDVVLNAAGGTYYNWSLLGSAFATHSNMLVDANTIISTSSQTRTYNVVGVDQYGCSNSTNIQVRLVPLTITAAYSSAPTGPNVTVSGNIPTAYTNATYTWTGPNGYISGPSTTIRNFSRIGLPATLAGTYIATVVQNGCSKSASFKLTATGQILKSLTLDSEAGNHEIDIQEELIAAGNITSTDEVFEEKNNMSFSLYPNPSSDKIRINGNVPVISYSIARIFDMSGNLVYDYTLGEKQSFDTEFDISGLSNGSYLLLLDCGENGTWKQVFTKE